MKKTGNILWGIVFIIVGLIFGLNALGITDINIFFDGWWTLFIIIPSSISIVKERGGIGNFIWLIIGIVLLLSAQQIIDISKIGKLIFPAILIALGMGMIFKDTVRSKINDKVKELNKENREEYYATFSGQKLNFTGDEFKGANTNAIFGGVDNKVKSYNENLPTIYIKAFCLFGGVEIK